MQYISWHWSRNCQSTCPCDIESTSTSRFFFERSIVIDRSRLWRNRNNTSYKMQKDAVKWSPSTNQHRLFTAGGPSCCPTYSVRALKEESVTSMVLRVPVPEDLKIQGFSRPFHSIIQGQFKAFQSIILFSIQPYWYLREKHTDLKHSCMTFINNKRSKQFFYPLNSNYGRKFSQSPSHQVLLKVSHRQIPNFSRPPTCFQNNSRTFSVLWNLRTFQGWPWIQGRCRNPGNCLAGVFHPSLDH